MMRAFVGGATGAAGACRGEVLRVALVIACLVSVASAQRARSPRRKALVWTNAPTVRPYPRRLQNHLLVGVGVGAGTLNNIDQQIRFYALEDLTAGGRIRVSDTRIVYEAEVGYAFERHTVHTPGTSARIHWIVLGGLGLQRDLTRLPFVGAAVRVHPRSTSKTTNMFAAELGVRGTYALGARADIEVTLGVSVLLPMIF